MRGAAQLAGVPGFSPPGAPAARRTAPQANTCEYPRFFRVSAGTSLIDEAFFPLSTSDTATRKRNMANQNNQGGSGSSSGSSGSTGNRQQESNQNNKSQQTGGGNKSQTGGGSRQQESNQNR
jgi:hypothetical protein